MKRLVSSMGGVVIALFVASFVYAADVPSTSGAHPQKGMVPGNIPATGDEDMAKIAAETLRGKLIKNDGGMYTVETGPGTQTQIRVGKDTISDNYSAVEGDWIEAIVAPDMHVKTIKKSSPGYTVDGSVLKVDGDFFVVKDLRGREIRLQTDNNTKMVGSHKVGESVRVEYTPDGHVLSVKPSTITRGESGG